MKLVIDRTKWFRGKSRGSRLYRKQDGKMCCLGFLSLACGYTVTEIRQHRTPFSLWDTTGEWRFPICREEQSSSLDDLRYIYGNLMITNDDEGISEPEREKQVTAEMKKLDVNVDFIN